MVVLGLRHGNRTGIAKAGNFVIKHHSHECLGLYSQEIEDRLARSYLAYLLVRDGRKAVLESTNEDTHNSSQSVLHFA